jgi:hypothetical protein
VKIDKPEFGNPKHIQFVKNERSDAEGCERCARKMDEIVQLKLEVQELRENIRILINARNSDEKNIS